MMPGRRLDAAPAPRHRRLGRTACIDQGHDRRLRLGLPRVVLDWHIKKVVGHYAGLQARAWHWLVALNRAVNRQFPGGIEGQSLNLMADNGCQPTALAFMRACAAIGIRQAFTSYNNPKGNADSSASLAPSRRSWCGSTSGPARPSSSTPLERWLADYNAGYLHSALGYRSPEAFEAEHLSHATPLPATC